MNVYVFDFEVIKAAMYPGNYVFVVSENSLPVDLTGCTIAADFIKKNGSQYALRMTTENNLIEVTDAAAGKWKFAKQKIDLQPGVYEYDVKFIFPNQDVYFYLKGEMSVINSKTTYVAPVIP